MILVKLKAKPKSLFDFRFKKVAVPTDRPRDGVITALPIAKWALAHFAPYREIERKEEYIQIPCHKSQESHSNSVYLENKLDSAGFPSGRA